MMITFITESSRKFDVRNLIQKSLKIWKISSSAFIVMAINQSLYSQNNLKFFRQYVNNLSITTLQKYIS